MGASLGAAYKAWSRLADHGNKKVAVELAICSTKIEAAVTGG
jgi:hypothetical protein